MKDVYDQDVEQIEEEESDSDLGISGLGDVSVGGHYELRKKKRKRRKKQQFAKVEYLIEPGDRDK